MKNPIYYIAFSLFAFVCSPHTTFCSTHYSIKHIYFEDLDPNARFREFYQTNNGDLLIATFGDGLIFYDGLEHRVYTKSNSNIIGDSVRALASDGHGGIWIGTNEGISHFDGKDFINFSSKTHSSFPNDSVFSILRINDSSTWFGMEDGYILKWTSPDPPTHHSPDSNHNSSTIPKWELIPLPESIAGKDKFDIRDIYQDKDESIWIGTQTLWQFKNTRWIHHDIPYLKSIRKITCFSDDSITVVTLNGVYNYNGNSWRIQSEEMKKNTSIVNMSDDKIMIGSENGLHYLHNGELFPIRLDEYIQSPFVEGLYNDRDGRIWIGTRNGLYVLINSSFTYIDRVPNHEQIIGIALDRHFSCPPIVIDKNHNLFTLTGDNYNLITQLPKNIGIYMGSSDFVEEKVWLLFRYKAVLLSTKYHEIINDITIPDTIVPNRITLFPDNSVLLLTHKGIFSLQSDEWKPHELFNQQHEEHSIHSLLQTDDGSFLFGWNGKLERMTHSKRKDMNLPLKTKSTKITDIFQDRQQNLFVGTNDSGIFQMTPTGWVNYTVHDGITGNHINTFYQESDGTLWAGSGLAGMAVLIDVMNTGQKQWIPFIFKDGVSFTHITCIGEYPKGTMWFGSRFNGVYRYQKNHFQPKISLLTNTYKWYTNENGIFQLDGVDYFNQTPEEFLRYSWRVLNSQDEVVKDWSSFQTNSEISVEISESGNYKFEAHVMDDDLNIGMQPVVSEFTVQMLPFYRQNWFIPFLFVLVSTIILILIMQIITKRQLAAHALELEKKVSIRTADLEKSYQCLQNFQKQFVNAIENEQERIGNELHDGVVQDLAAIAMTGSFIAKELQQHNSKYAHEIENIIGMINRSSKHIRKIAKGLSPIQLDSPGLISTIEQLAAQISTTQTMQCTFEYDHSIADIPSEKLLHIYRFVQEAVSNAVKHSKANQITISITKENQQFQVLIRDNGIGFDVDSNSTKGLGIHTLQYRADELGGTLSIKSVLQQGTDICCFIKKDT